MEIENKINDGTILFFDFDGTLVETDYSNFLAYNKAINTILDKNILYNPNERFTREKLLLIFPYLTKKQYEKIIEKKEVYFKEFLSKTKLNKIVYGILNKYSRNNITVLVTNSRKDRALLILNYYNLNDKFDYIFYRQLNGTEEKNKFKNAISKLNISPKLVLVFENEQSEISNAVDAGIPKENIISITT